MDAIRVTVWNEHVSELNNRAAAAIYPSGIHPSGDRHGPTRRPWAGGDRTNNDVSRSTPGSGR